MKLAATFSLAGFGLAGLCASGSAAAQTTVSATVASDLRERGLSLTGGRAAAQARVGHNFSSGLTAEVAATTLRGSPRFGGADVGIDASLGYHAEAGPVFADAGLFGRAYPGGDGGQAHGEVYGGVGARIALAEVDVSAAYAPDQSAIGGDNLYLRARGRVAVVGTPFTLVAHVGRSSGSADDPFRAARLRPAGSYHDWGLSADYVVGPARVGIAYTDTDISARRAFSSYADARHVGSRIAVRAGFTL